MVKKSLAKKAFSAIASLVVWLAKAIYRAIIFVLKALFSIASKGAHKAATSLAKPKAKAQFTQFKEIETNSGSLASFEGFIYSQKNTVGIIIGARGSGKSALGTRILENAAFNSRKAFAMGFNEKTLPNWIKPIETAEQVPNGSFLLVDEGGIVFSSRESLSEANKLLSKLLLIARHKDLSLLFISQNSANIDVNALRQADFLLLKKPSLMQKDFERKEIGKKYEKLADGFKKHTGEKGLFYCYSDQFTGFAANDLPTFWTEKTSKAFANVKMGK